MRAWRVRIRTVARPADSVTVRAVWRTTMPLIFTRRAWPTAFTCRPLIRRIVPTRSRRWWSTFSVPARVAATTVCRREVALHDRGTERLRIRGRHDQQQPRQYCKYEPLQGCPPSSSRAARPRDSRAPPSISSEPRPAGIVRRFWEPKTAAADLRESHRERDDPASSDAASAAHALGRGPRTLRAMRTTTAPTIDDIHAAAARLDGVVLRTPLVRLNADGLDAEVWLKLENLQPIGSFKLRGATNALRRLPAGGPARRRLHGERRQHGPGRRVERA